MRFQLSVIIKANSAVRNLQTKWQPNYAVHGLD